MLDNQKGERAWAFCASYRDLFEKIAEMIKQQENCDPEQYIVSGELC